MNNKPLLRVGRVGFQLLAYSIWLVLAGCAPTAAPAPPPLPTATAEPTVTTMALAAVTPTVVPTTAVALPLITKLATATPTPTPTASPTPTNTPTVPPPSRVLIIVVDGLRPDAISAERTPHIWELAQMGTYSWAAQTISPSLTLPSHTSMLSGVDFYQHGVWWNDDLPERPPITTPTLFTYTTAAGLRSLAVYGKTKIMLLAQPEVTTQSIYALGDEGVSMRFAQLLAEEGSFDLMFTHLPQVDGAGHTLGWMSEGYLAAVAQADTAVGTILQALADEGLRETTTVLLTADHGGIDFHHADPTLAVNRTIPWILNGPAAVGGGVVLTQPIETYDTAATALAILHLPLPKGLDGEPVGEALK